LNATEQPSSFTSPNYPNEYPLNKEIRWSISALEGQLIVLTFLAGSVEPCCDLIEVSDGNWTYSCWISSKLKLLHLLNKYKIFLSKNIAVIGDRMFLGTENFDFAQI